MTEWFNNLSRKAKAALASVVVMVTAIIGWLTDFLDVIQAASQAAGG